MNYNIKKKARKSNSAYHHHIDHNTGSGRVTYLEVIAMQSCLVRMRNGDQSLLLQYLKSINYMNGLKCIICYNDLCV
jgi:hypothetical protein